MNTLTKIIAVKVVLIGLIAIAYWMARLPEAKDAHALADQFNIERIALPYPGVSNRVERVVHPRIERMARWVSSSGSAVAIADLNHDGYSDEVVLCEPRTDEILLYRVTKNGAIEGPRSIFSIKDVPGVMVDGQPVAYAPIGLLISDLNADSLTDILIFFMGRSPVILYQKRSNQIWRDLDAFTFTIADLLPAPEIWNSNTAIASDLNGDTYLDLIIGNYGTDGIHYLDPLDAEKGGRGPRPTAPDSMSRAYNGGKNRYLIWNPEEARLVPADPVIVRPENGELVAVSEREIRQIDESWTLAIAAADLNGDLLPELYFANDFGPDRFFLNRSSPEEMRFVLVEGKRDLQTPRSKVLGHDSFKGMGVDFADINGDRFLDMFVSNLTTEFAFEESHFLRISAAGYEEALNRGQDPFTERSEAMGVARSHWAWDVKFADLNNDGIFEILQATGFVEGTENRWARFHELVMSNDALVEDPTRWPNLVGLGNDGLGGNAPNSIFVYDKSQDRFFDLAGVLDFMQVPPETGRGVAVADVDRDGDQDFVFSNQWQDSYVFLNHHYRPNLDMETSESINGFLSLDLYIERGSATEGIRQLSPEATRLNLGIAVGSVVTVWKRDPGSQPDYIGMDYIDGGNGYTGQNAPGAHVSVPDGASGMLEVEIAWLEAPFSVRRETLQLSPGFHALVLPVSAGGEVDVHQPIAVNP